MSTKQEYKAAWRHVRVLNSDVCTPLFNWRMSQSPALHYWIIQAAKQNYFARQYR